MRNYGEKGSLLKWSSLLKWLKLGLVAFSVCQGGVSENTGPGSCSVTETAAEEHLLRGPCRNEEGIIALLP